MSDHQTALSGLVVLKSSRFILLFAVFFSESAAFTNDTYSNKIVGEPFVSCAADAIYAKWKTWTTFSGGSVNVKHSPPERQCYQTLVTNNQIELLIPHQDCRLNRLRVLNPPGLIIEANVLISFHGEFISDGDRLFTLKCFHMGNPKKIGNGTLVIPSPTKSLSAELATTPNSPKCAYDIFLDDANVLGKRRRVASREPFTIGTPLYHEWTCRGVRDSQCLIVTNCVVKTADSERQIVDHLGCSTVPDLVPQLNYSAVTKITQRIPIFTMKEPSSLYFQCQLNLVDVSRNKNSSKNHCPVPQCNNRKRRQSIIDILEFIQNSKTQVADVLSERIEIAAFNDNYESEPFEKARTKRPKIFSDTQLLYFERDDVCLSTLAAALFTFALVTTSTAVTAIIIFKCMRDKFYYAMRH